QPIPLQYWDYVSGIVQGDWGRSILSRRPVLEDLASYWPATLELVIVAMLIATAAGVPLGVISAVKADKMGDHLARVVSLLGVSVPAFWLAVLLQLFFALRLGWLPANGRLDPLTAAPPHLTGLYLIDSAVAGQWATFGAALRQIILPAVTLSFPALATIARFTRTSLLEVLNQDYVRTARAKGVIERRVVTRHGLRNALIPLVTMIGLSFGWSMGGSVLVETVFDWPGLGLYATKSALTLDFMPIMGIALLYGFVFSLINIAVDLTYGMLDPRIRHV
ncbi:MAG TPA: ABC transporter permease, partial [Thermomicrobiales bacterium]|nr:ABC transporter permease [Thermomicrobiales bacterium]